MLTLISILLSIILQYHSSLSINLIRNDAHYTAPVYDCIYGCDNDLSGINIVLYDSNDDFTEVTIK